MIINSNEKVSIVMPAHNASKYISESIESVLAQTYNNWELIIINDRSTDQTRDIVAGYSLQDDRILLIDNKLSVGGAFYARNLGLDKSTGKYIAFLDSDDLWLPEKLSSQINIMNEKGYFISHCSYVRVDEVGTSLKNVYTLDVVSYKDQLKSNKIPNLTGIYDRSKIDIVKQRNVGHEDYDMWLRILKQYPSIGISTPLAHYRVLSDSLSSNKFKAAIWHYKILKYQKEIGHVERFYYYMTYMFNAVLKRL